MKTTKDERAKWNRIGQCSWREHDLIDDVDEATRLLRGLNEAARLRSLLQSRCESCGADGNIAHSPTCLRVATDIFLKEPSDGDNA